MAGGGDDWLRLGALTAPWGLRGEVKAQLDADPSYVAQIGRVYLGDERRAVGVQGLHRRGRLYTLKLAGVDTVEAAEGLRDRVVWLPRAEAPALPAGTYYVEDVVGLRAVTTDGRELGTIADIVATGANDVYVVQARDKGGEILIPAIRDVVVAIDPAAGLVRIEPMPGLLD